MNSYHTKAQPQTWQKSSAVKQYAWLLRFLFVFYIANCLFFFFRPDELFYLLNVGPRVFKTFEEIQVPAQRFWSTFAASNMLCLGFICLFASFSPRSKGYTFLLFISNASTGIGFLYFFLKQQPYFAYLAGAFVDCFIALILLVFYLRTLSVAFDNTHFSSEYSERPKNPESSESSDSDDLPELRI